MLSQIVFLLSYGKVFLSENRNGVKSRQWPGKGLVTESCLCVRDRDIV